MTHAHSPARRGLLAGAAALLVAVVTACGTGSDTTAPTAAPTAGGAFPVTIPHAFGETVVPAEPTRVVTVGFNEADFALALGVVPLGVRDFFGDYDETARPWAQEALAGAQPVDLGGTELDVEAVAALAPDLILGVYSFMDQSTYDRLSSIAPTVAQPTNTTTAATWQEQTRTTGLALGRSERAEQVVADTEQAFADARAANPQFAGRTLGVDFIVDGTPYLLGTDDLRAQVFAGLGFTVTDTTETLSDETLGRLDQDAVVVVGATQEDLAGNAVFAALPAVREGRTVYLGGYDTEFAGAIGFGSPLSLPYAIDIVVPQLAAVVPAQ